MNGTTNPCFSSRQAHVPFGQSFERCVLQTESDAPYGVMFACGE